MGKRVCTAALFALLAITGASPAEAKVRLKAASLGEHGVAVRVATPAKAVRLTARPRGVVRAKRVRMRDRSRRIVRLRLTAAGRRAIANCTLDRLTIRARRARRRVALPACTAPAPSTPGAHQTQAGGSGSSTATSPGGSPAPDDSHAPEPPAEPADPNAPPPATEGTLADALMWTFPGCDFLDPWACLLPFPNDLFTRADPTTPTGLRVDLPLHGMPKNRAGKPVDPTDWNRNDGWSSGSPILTKVRGLTLNGFERSGIVPQTDLARAYDADQPVVLIDAETGQRQGIWAEMDEHPETPDGERTLIIRQTKNLEPNRRYIVAIRNLVDAYDKPIPALRRFQLYRDNIHTLSPLIEGRRAHMERIFTDLGAAGIARRDLILAWDFTTASTEDRTGRMLHIRDDAFAQLEDFNLADLKVDGHAPQFEVTSDQRFTPEQNANVARRIEGTFVVPCYMDKPACPPAANRFLLDADDKPVQLPQNTMETNFICNMPHTALATPARASLYGHGLFGSAGEVDAGNVKTMGQEHNIAFCATDWTGMATTDVPNVATILVDLSNFSTLADRVQQGILNFLYLGRLMIHPNGFAGHEAFRSGGAPLIDTSHLFYDGNSQGGILGTAVMGVSPDAQRGVLGVPGMNYSTLLQRSVDFETDPDNPCPAPPDQLIEDAQEPEMDPEYALELFNLSYACPLYIAYPNIKDRQLIFSLMQQLWDRGEGNSYAAYIRGGLPNTPPHEVLLHVALADHQVAQVAAEVEARTIGAAIRPTPFDPDRTLDVEPAFGIERIRSFPYSGSAIEIWDSGPVRTNPDGSISGTGLAPAANLPPREGRDPHGEPRSTKSARRQKSEFLRPPGQSAVIDVCNGGPCYSRGWKGAE